MNEKSQEKFELSEKIRAVRRLKKLLGRSFYSFIGRFGKPTTVQLAAVEPILSGKNVLLVAPTASGKTEAVLAPVVERIARGCRDSLSVLYIVPTRALANNLLQRMAPPLDHLSFRTATKHSDSPHISLPLDFLITTPESLDSLLCRRPHFFQRLRAVIVDEVHVLDGTCRGDQLRVLLSRLGKTSRISPLQIILVSASVHDPQVIAERYVTDPTVIEIKESRQWELCFFHSLEDFVKCVRHRRLRKILCFCNYRESAEQTAKNLHSLLPSYPVFVHHGSLSRSKRLETEDALRHSPVSICVATSTLEVGIDIGNIDFILLVEVPWSASSMMQRVGRGNRRSRNILAGALIRSRTEKEILTAMHDAIFQGVLEPVEYHPDPGVIVQQIFSCAFQFRNGVSHDYLASVLSPLCASSRLLTYVDFLCESGWLVPHRGKLFASEKLMNLGERGKIHSNIPDGAALSVIDSTTQKVIGRIDGNFDEVFILARRAWKVVKVDGRCVYVRPYHGKASPASFIPRRNRSSFNRILPPSLREEDH